MGSREGAAPLGFSLVMLQVYYSMDQVLLGLLTNKAEVGQYAAAAKLPVVLSGFTAIWLSAVYPHASKLFTHDPMRCGANSEASLRSASWRPCH